jgi:hypothetical protein
MCARNMGAYVRPVIRSTKSITQEEISDSHAAKKGTKKLASSYCARILVKESSD